MTTDDVARMTGEAPQRIQVHGKPAWSRRQFWWIGDEVPSGMLGLVQKEAGGGCNLPDTGKGFIFTDEQDAQKACEWWKKELRLTDWDLKCWIKRQEDFSSNNAQAEYRLTSEHKEGWIKLLNPIDYLTDTSWPQDHEKSLVHELGHIHMNSFLPEDGTLARVALEQATELIACALIRLRRLAYPEPPWRANE